MRQDPSNPYFFYTAHDEKITVVVVAKNTYPFVVGAGSSPTFLAHPVDPKKNSRTFEFVESHPPDVDSVELRVSFLGEKSNAKYDVLVSGSSGGAVSKIPTLKHVRGLSVQSLGLFFLKNDEFNASVELQ